MADNDELLRRLLALSPEEQARIRAQLEHPAPPAAPAPGGTANVQGNARVYGPTVGTNLGTIIYNGAPTDEQREQLVRYLDRVVHKLQRLRLGGLSPLDDQGLQLPNVYIMLATTRRERVAQGTAAQVRRYFVDGDPGRPLKQEYDPDWALPVDARFYVGGAAQPDGRGASAATHMLERAVLMTEAANQHQRFVLLGDPGGGKSTCVRHLAWALAERGLDRIDAATALFRWADEARLLPIILPLRKLAGRIAAEGAEVATVSAALRDEMTREYDARRADELLDKALAHGAALLLFDGLDEVPLEGVPGQTAGRLTTLRAVRDFVELHSRAQAIITCRTRAFDAAPRHCLDWPVETLAPLTLGQMRHFVGAWYAELTLRGSLDHEQAERQRQTLIDAIVARSKLRQMAGTPLLLTMMALVLYEKGELPRDRPQLYERILEQLLGAWDQQKDGRGFAQVIGDDKVQSEVLRPLLDRLSFEAHATAASADGRGRLRGDRLLLELAKTLDAVRVADPFHAAQRCLAYFDERSGLLVPEDGGDQYAFAHLTLQEYCAGRHLLLAPQATDLVMERRADDRWREPILLGLGVIHKQYAPLADRIGAILLGLAHRKQRGQAKPVARWYRDLMLAAEIGADRDWDLLRPLIDVERVQDELRDGLVTLVQDTTQPLPAAERVRAGFLLGDLGDPRFPVTPEQWRREIERAWAGDTSGYFCRVAAGAYIIGSADDDPDADDNEKPQHRVTFDAPFLIGRYPVTNAQWQTWVAAGGWQGYFADRADFNRPNQPVVGVSWQMCSDFCTWLSGQTGATVRLPAEEEWDAAARGGDARRYPWGDAWRDDHAATKEDQETRGWRWTAPAGCYPAGAAPCGALDLAGNVWEWTASAWRSYPGAPKTFEETLYKVLRGGSYGNDRTYVRCGARLRNLPVSVFDFSLGLRVVVAPRLAQTF